MRNSTQLSSDCKAPPVAAENRDGLADLSPCPTQIAWDMLDSSPIPFEHLPRSPGELPTESQSTTNITLATDSASNWNSANIIKSGPLRTIYRVEIDQFGYILKRFHTSRSLAQRIKSLFKNYAKREVHAAHRLAKSRIPTIHPLGIGRTFCCQLAELSAVASIQAGKSSRSPTNETYLLMEMIPHAGTLADVWERLRLAEGDAHSARVRRELAWQFGTLVARLHASRIIHRDLHPGNVLVSEFDAQNAPSVSASTGKRFAKSCEMRLHVIDVLETTQPVWLTTAARCRNLAKIHNYFARRASIREKLTFISGYQKTFDEPRKQRKSSFKKLKTQVQKELASADRKGDRKWSRPHSQLSVRTGALNKVFATKQLSIDVVELLAETPILSQPWNRLQRQGLRLELPPDNSPRTQKELFRRWHALHALQRRQLPVETPLALVSSLYDATTVLLLPQQTAQASFNEAPRTYRNARKFAAILETLFDLNFRVESVRLSDFFFAQSTDTPAFVTSAETPLTIAATLKVHHATWKDRLRLRQANSQQTFNLVQTHFSLSEWELERLTKQLHISFRQTSARNREDRSALNNLNPRLSFDEDREAA